MCDSVHLVPAKKPANGLNVVVHYLQVLEPDFFQYLSERPLGDGLFYCYRWFLVSYKRGQSPVRFINDVIMM